MTLETNHAKTITPPATIHFHCDKNDKYKTQIDKVLKALKNSNSKCIIEFLCRAKNTELSEYFFLSQTNNLILKYLLRKINLFNKKGELLG